MAKPKIKLVIENHRASLIELPGEVDKDGEVIAEGTKLIPGENNVSKEEWDKAKKNEVIRMYCAMDYLEEKGEGEAKSLADGLNNIEKHDALKRIAQCKNIKLLNIWIEQSKNESLTKTCKARIKELIDAEGKD